MSHIDVNAFVGGYPFRHLPHPEPAGLLRVLRREGLGGAWVGHLPTAFYRDPEPGNEELMTMLEEHAGVLHAAPAVRPDWPGWERRLGRIAEGRSVAVRAYPSQWGLAPQHPAMRRLAGACGELGVPLLLTVRFEDLRQRHWLDAAPDVSGAAIRDVVRATDRVRVVVTGAGRALVEEVFWGLTVEERSRLWWDISWLWGPPEDHLAHLLRTVGPDRFVFGTGWPLRLAQSPRAGLALLSDELLAARLANAADIADKRTAS